MINYSFIIPNKNTHLSLLKRCVHSIPPLDDVQIIVVDDNSNLGKDYIENIATLNVELLQLPETKGPGNARNQGLKRAEGGWIFFIDSDDYYDTNNLLKLLIELRDSPYDIVWFARRLVYADKAHEDYYGISVGESIINCKEERWRLGRSMAIWNKAIKSNFITENSIQFGDMMIGEDVMPSVRLLCDSKNPGFFPHVVYNYDISRASLSKTIDLSLNKICIESYICGYTYWVKHGNLKPEYTNNDMAKRLVNVFIMSRNLYWRYLILTCISVSYNFARHQYTESCKLLGRNQNIFVALMDDVKVHLALRTRYRIMRNFIIKNGVAKKN